VLLAAWLVALVDQVSHLLLQGLALLVRVVVAVAVLREHLLAVREALVAGAKGRILLLLLRDLQILAQVVVVLMVGLVAVLVQLVALVL
jgi:hypothetical protein